MLFELREYDIKKGQMAAWLTLMQEEVLPYQASHGMVVVASFVGVENPDKHIWIRRFENEAERVRIYKDVYESAQWLNVIEPKIHQLLNLETMKVTQMVATSRSPIQ